MKWPGREVDGAVGVEVAAGRGRRWEADGLIVLGCWVRRSSPAVVGGRGRQAGPAEVAGAGAARCGGWAASGQGELRQRGSDGELQLGRS